MVAFIQDTRALFSGTRSHLFRHQYPVAPTSTATSYLMPHPLHLLSMGLMFVLLFQDPKNSRSICVLLSSLQLPLYNNIHLSHWSWKCPFRPIFPFSLSYWLIDIVRQWFCSSCPTIYLYMRFFACGRSTWLSTALIGCACLSPLGSTTLFLGLVRSNIASLIDNCPWMFPFNHISSIFSLLYKFSFIVQLCQQFPHYSQQHPPYNNWLGFCFLSSHTSHHYLIPYIV